MHREPLLDLLDRYERTWPDEADTILRMRDFVHAHRDCFQRELSIGHLTGSAWLLDLRAERVLLTHHRKIDAWMQLGGHADGDPDLLAVAMREAEEESGIGGVRARAETLFDIDIHEIPERRDEPAHLHYDCRFLLQVTDHERYRVGDESHDLAWVEFDRVAAFTREESVLRMVRKSLPR